MFTKSPVKSDVFFDDLPIVTGLVNTKDGSFENKKEAILAKIVKAIDNIVYKSGIFGSMVVNKCSADEYGRFHEMATEYKKNLKALKKEIEKSESLADIKAIHGHFYENIVKPFDPKHNIMEINVFKLGLSTDLQNINLAFLKKLTLRGVNVYS